MTFHDVRLLLLTLANGTSCNVIFANVSSTERTSDTLTLKVLVATIDAQWEGMGDVGSARYERHYIPHARP